MMPSQKENITSRMILKHSELKQRELSTEMGVVGGQKCACRGRATTALRIKSMISGLTRNWQN